MYVRWMDKNLGRYRHGFCLGQAPLLVTACEVRTVVDCDVVTVLVDRSELRPMAELQGKRRFDAWLVATLEDRTEKQEDMLL